MSKRDRDRFRNDSRKRSALVIFTAVVSGILIGAITSGVFHPASASSSLAAQGKFSLRLNDPNYKLISPLLLADSGAPANPEIQNRLKLETYDLLNIPNMQTISIYFRDLKTGTWAGIGADMEYDPASLLKVPIMIAWFKKAEDNPGILSESLYYKGGTNDNKGINFYSLTPGASYTVDYLINLMITKSDNDAKDLLLENLDAPTLTSVFTDLGIEAWGSAPDSSTHISASIYSRFLRILYNGTYLNHEYSEKALELLSGTSFNDGLVAGVPQGTVVAHKFGEYEDATGAMAELHDCGIVYHPTHPYLICVMTRGAGDISAATLTNVIKVTSQTVYDIVNNDLSVSSQ